MTEYVQVHPKNPQPRQVARVVAQLHAGAVIAYPTDSSYALGCHMGDKAAMERIRRLRGFGRHHHFTLLCRDLSEVSTYAKFDNRGFRLLKSLTPGPYTFVLPATHGVPRRALHEKRKTIGIRIPDHPVALALLRVLGEPLMSCTLILPGDQLPLSEPEQVYEALANRVDIIVDSGACGLEPTTVLDLTAGEPRLLRAGKGDVNRLL
ncbi:MAG TPA: L-threonylcarbamoyladenylate synthase [Nevskiales bacterium]|nr:L-threonylcarbamoyladenylate synthase [Nevskiales bacterium]